MDTVKKAGSSFPKDDAKKLEKEVSLGLKQFCSFSESISFEMIWMFSDVWSSLSDWRDDEKVCQVSRGHV